MATSEPKRWFPCSVENEGLDVHGGLVSINNPINRKWKGYTLSAFEMSVLESGGHATAKMRLRSVGRRETDVRGFRCYTATLLRDAGKSMNSC